MRTAEGTSPRADRAVVVIEAAVAVAVVSAVIGSSYGPAATVGFLMVGSALAATVVFIVRAIGALRDPALDVPPEPLDEERIALEHEKAILLQGIKELEGDSGTGKVDREDYQGLRRAAEARAMEIIRQLKTSERRWLDEAEALVVARTGRATPRPAREADQAPEVAPTAAAPVAFAGPSLLKVRPIVPGHPGLFPTDSAVFSAVDGGRARCGACGTETDAEARFCPGCGRARAHG